MEALYDVKARLVRTLAHPKRLEIIDLLEADQRTVTEIATAIRLSQAGTSQHLAILRRGGIVEVRRERTHVHYRLRDPVIGAACRMMNDAVVAVLAREQEVARPILAAGAQR